MISKSYQEQGSGGSVAVFVGGKGFKGWGEVLDTIFKNCARACVSVCVRSLNNLTNISVSQLLRDRSLSDWETW